MLNESSGKLLKNTGAWKFRSIINRNGSLAGHLNDVLIREMQRNNGMGKAYVTEEMFSLLFQSKITMFGRDIDVSVVFNVDRTNKISQIEINPVAFNSNRFGRCLGQL